MNASAQAKAKDVKKEPASKVSHWVIHEHLVYVQCSCPPAKHHRSLITELLSQDIPTPAELSYTQNLERELKLMASAYHDLASRLQMNTIVLQRRAEAPKSWLGRQRKAMEGVGGLVR